LTNETSAFVDDFRELLTTFADEGVDFVLIGGWALGLHGHGRGTDDLDVLVRPTPQNAEQVFRALVRFGAPVSAHGVTEGLFARSGYGYRMGVKPNLIEILTKVDGIEFDEAIEEGRQFELDGRTIRYIGRQALLRNKRAAGRPKDLADVDWLEKHPEEE
jgi:Nucleotidyl transferase of unknown function (DUF2204)